MTSAEQAGWSSRQARLWREKHNLTRAQLAELIGYAAQTIFWFEQGQTPPDRRNDGTREIKPWVWLRYQRACQGLDAELRGVKFKW